MSTSNLALVPKKNNLAGKFADKFNVEEQKVMDILKSTAFKQRDGNPPSDNQMMALMIVADQYGLNPFVKEIYAYPDKSNGIVPVVGVDGWSRIMNDHPQMDGIEFRYSDETVEHKGKKCHVWIECVITRKDRSKPIVVREYFDEVVRSTSFATPWDSHPKRMHRHKAEIQCARIAFGFAGIYDEDEAERILEKDVTAQGETLKPEVKYVLDADFETSKAKFKGAIDNGKHTVESLTIWIETKGKLLTESQKAEINSWVKAEPVTIENEAEQDPFLADYEEGEK
jgi:phage recombination protein Bet